MSELTTIGNWATFRVLEPDGVPLISTDNLDDALLLGRAISGRRVEQRHPVYGWLPVNPQLRVARERRWRDSYYESGGRGDRE